MKADFPDIEEILDKNKSLGKYDPTSFESMESLCNDYNWAVEKLLLYKVFYSLTFHQTKTSIKVFIHFRKKALPLSIKILVKDAPVPYCNTF